MTLFLVRRILQGAIIIVAMSVLVFVGIYAVGNPVEILINPDATPEIKRQAASAGGRHGSARRIRFDGAGHGLAGRCAGV